MTNAETNGFDGQNSSEVQKKWKAGFLGQVDGLLKQFVPLHQEGPTTVLPRVDVRHSKNGSISFLVSGKRDEEGNLRRGRLLIVRGHKKLDIVINATDEEQSYRDPKQAYMAMLSVTREYQRSRLPRLSELPRNKQ